MADLRCPHCGGVVRVHPEHPHGDVRGQTYFHRCTSCLRAVDPIQPVESTWNKAFSGFGPIIGPGALINEEA